MEMDWNMAFAVLGIEMTKDENLIRSAYRMALPANNPEENPKGFQSLRQAYETALEYSRTPDSETQLTTADMIDANTPIGAFRIKLANTYQSISSRINEEAWKELLKDEVFDGLDSYEEAKWALFTYLAENYRIPNEIYQLLDERFDIRKNAQEFKEKLPVGFVDYMTANINNAGGGYSYAWMRMFKGRDDADYDTFLSYRYELEGELYHEDKTRAGDLIKAMDALEIWHPYYALDKVVYLIETGKKEEAREIVLALADEEAYWDEIPIQMGCGEMFWRIGEKDKAYQSLCRGLALDEENYIGNKYAAFYEMEHGELRKALRHVYAVRNLSDDKELNSAADKLEQEFIALCEKNIEHIEADDVRLLVYAYSYQKEPDKAIAIITSKPSYEKEIKGYQMLLSYLYKQKQDYDKALEHGRLRLEVIKDKIKNLEEGHPVDEDDTAESLMRSLSDSNLQLGLILMMRAKEEASPKQRVETYQEAVSFLTDAQTAAPVHVTVQLNLAYCYSEMREYGKAYEIYEELIEKIGAQNGLLFLKQRVCYEMGRAQEVIDLLYEMLDKGAKEAGIYEYTARVFLDYEQFEDAKNIFARADEADLTSYGLRALKLIYECLSKPADKGFKMEFNKVLDEMLIEGEKSAEDFYIRDYLAELYYLKAMYAAQFQQNKIPHLKSAIEVYDRPKYHMQLVAYYNEKDQQQEVLQEYLYIEKFFQPNTELYLKIAQCYHELNDLDNARTYIKKMIALETDNPNIYKAAARANDDMAVKRRPLYQDSILFWGIYINSDPEDIDFAFYRRGCALLQLGKYEDAAADFKRAYDLADENEKYNICVSLGKAHEGLGHFEWAVKYLEQALHSLKKSERGEGYAFTAVLSLSHNYMKLGRVNDMEKLLQGNLKYFPPERQSRIVRELRDSYRAAGEYEKALNILQEYSNLFAESYYVYLRLSTKRCACTAIKEKKSLLKEIKKMLHRYNTYDLRGLYADMLAYDFLMVKEAIPLKEKQLSYTSSDHEELDWDEDSNDALELIRLNKFLGREKEVEHYKRLIVNALHKRFDGWGGDIYDNFIESDPSARLDNLTGLVEFLSITGELALAGKYAAMLESCVMCSFCSNMVCCDRFEALGIYYEAKGETELAYAYFEKAVRERGYYKGYAKYRLMTRKKK